MAHIPKGTCAPPNVAYHTAVPFQQSIVVFGGRPTNYQHGSNRMYQFLPGLVFQVLSVPYQIVSHSVGFAGHRTNWVEIVSRTPELVPSPRKCHTAVVVDHTMFVYGGVSVERSSARTSAFVDVVHGNRFHAFDFRNLKWEIIDEVGVSFMKRVDLNAITDLVAATFIVPVCSRTTTVD